MRQFIIADPTHQFYTVKYDNKTGRIFSLRLDIVEWLNEQGIFWQFNYPHLIVFSEQDKTAVLLHFG